MMRRRVDPTKKRALTIGLLTVCLALATAPGDSEEASERGLTAVVEQILWAAESALEDGEVQIAESDYRTALREGWLLLGMLEAAAGDLPAAREAAEQATRATAGGTRVARIALALVQTHTGELGRSVSALEILAGEKPNDLPTRLHLAHALVLAGRMEDLRRELEELRPKLPDRVARLERALAETEGDEEARRDSFLPRLNVGRLAELSPPELGELRARLRATQARIYRNLGALHDRAGRPERAAEHFARADEIAPPRPPGAAEPVALAAVDLLQGPPGPAVRPLAADEATLWKTATVELLPVLRMMEAGQVDEAEAALRRMLEAGDDPAARVTLAVLYAGAGRRCAATEERRREEAEEQLLAAIAAETETEVEINARQHLARLYLTLGREDDAARQLRAAAALGALERDLALKLAAIELAADREPAAREVLRKTVQSYRSVQALLRLAELASTEDGPESAQALLGQAQGLAPSCEEVLARSARAWLAAGRPEQALRSLEPLRRMHPTVAEYADLLGQARRQLGQAEEADPPSGIPPPPETPEGPLGPP